MALYADDAVSMPDSEPMQVGKAAIQKAQEAEFKTMPKDMNFTFETMDVYGDGDIVTETGKSIYKDASGKVTGTGKYVAIFKKQDGKYLCIREIFNNDSKQ
jgi:ketosteroid isomerase-like protein